MKNVTDAERAADFARREEHARRHPPDWIRPGVKALHDPTPDRSGGKPCRIRSFPYKDADGTWLVDYEGGFYGPDDYGTTWWTAFAPLASA